MKGQYWNKYTLIELLQERFTEFKDKTAVIYEGKELSYEALNIKSNALAKHLVNQGVQTNDVVAICAERSLELIVGILAIIKVGGVYLPIEASTPLERVKYMLKDSQAKLFLSYKKYKDKTPPFIPCVIIDNNVTKEEGYYPISSTTPTDELFAIFTSGTTGVPKGTVLRNNSFVNLLEWYTNEVNLAENETTLVYTPVSFDATQKCIFSALLTGGRLLLASSKPYEPSRLLNHIQSYEVNHIITTPSSFYPILRLAEKEKYKPLSSLRILSLNGETTNAKNLRNWLSSHYCQATVYNLYGPSECTDISISRKFNDVTLLEDDEGSIIGKPISNVDAYVLDSEYQFIQAGEIGELYLGGLCVGNGYFDKSLNQGKFILNPFKENEMFYKTGDLVRLLDDGNIRYVGRIDNQIKLRGQRVELDEIEKITLQYPGILHCSVSYNAEKQFLTLYYFSENMLDPEGLRFFLKEKLPVYSVPSFLYQVSDMPLNKNGKVDRHALAQFIISPKRKHEEVWSELELKIKEIWKSFIYTDAKKDDIFFHVGGDSLTAYVIISELMESFNVNINMKEFYDNPTIKGLSNLIKGKITQTTTPTLYKTGLEIEEGACIVTDNELERLASSCQKFNKAVHEKVTRGEVANQYTFPYFRKSKNGFKGKKSDIYHFVHQIVLADVSIQEVKLAFRNLLQTQPLLRTTLIERDREFGCYEHYYQELDIDYLDLSSFEKESKTKIENHLFQTMNHSINQNWNKNQLYYRFCVLKLNERTYKLLFVFEHLISDTETERILNSYFGVQTDNHQSKQTDDYRVFLESIYHHNKDQKLKQYKGSPQYRSLRKEIDLFYQKHHSYSKGSPIILSNPKIIEMDMQSFDENLGSIPIHYFFYVVTNLLSITFQLKNIPSRIFINKRSYGELNFYNTIGDFSETIPVIYDSEVKTGELHYQKYKEHNNFLSQHKIALKSFRFDPEIFDVIYLSCPFTYNFLGEVTDEQDYYYKEKASNFHSLPYPVLGYYKEQKLTLIINNGLGVKEQEKIEQFLHSWKISYKITNKE